MLWVLIRIVYEELLKIILQLSSNTHLICFTGKSLIKLDVTAI